MIPPPTILALSESGVWHVATTTYSSAADTACGLIREPCTVFMTEGNPDLALYSRRRCSCARPRSAQRGDSSEGGE